MTSHAEGTFTVQGWDEKPYLELPDGTKLTKATMTFGFLGDVTGEGICETVLYYRADGTSAYTGLQRMVGQVGGREGTFVLQADGSYLDGTATSTWQVIDGSGTGELAELRGTGTSVAQAGPGGSYTFDYSVG